MSTETQIFERYALAFKPKPKLHIYEWARNGQVKLDNTSPITGFYKVENSPYLREPLEAFRHSRVRMVTTIGPNQGGRTKAMEVACLWALEHRPGPMMWNTITNDKAEDFMKTRWWPMAKACPDVSKLLPEDGRDVRPRSFLMSNGMPFIAQGANESNLQEKSVMTQFNDECFQWSPGHLDAAWKRCNVSYAWNYKVWNGSTGGIEGDDIDKAFEEADAREYHFHCLNEECQHEQPFDWGKPGRKGGVKWEVNERTKRGGEYDYAALKKTVYYECEECGFRHTDSLVTRRKMNANAFYKPRDADELGLVPEIVNGRKAYPFNEFTSYRYNILCVNWPGLSWGTWVEEFLKATKSYKLYGNAEPLRLFWSRRMARSWNEAKYCNAQERVIVSQYKIGSPSFYILNRWDLEKHRFMGVDKQALEYPFVIRAVAENGSSRLLERGYLSSYAEIEATAEEFGVDSKSVLIDAGYETTEVYAAALLRNWTCLMGSGTKQEWLHYMPDPRDPRRRVKIKRPYSEEQHGDPTTVNSATREARGIGGLRMGDNGKLIRDNQLPKYARLFQYGNLPIKDILNAFKRGRTKVEWQLPEDIGDDYLKQINAEVRYRIEKKHGFEYWWSNAGKDGKGRKRPNHYWDCEAMIVCAMAMQRIINLDEWQLPKSIDVYTSAVSDSEVSEEAA